MAQPRLAADQGPGPGPSGWECQLERRGEVLRVVKQEVRETGPAPHRGRVGVRPVVMARRPGSSPATPRPASRAMPTFRMKPCAKSSESPPIRRCFSPSTMPTRSLLPLRTSSRTRRLHDMLGNGFQWCADEIPGDSPKRILRRAGARVWQAVEPIQLYRVSYSRRAVVLVDVTSIIRDT
jgi:hypothetical protein